MAANFAWGIDVGNRALKAVKLIREGDQLLVDDFDVIEHETVLSHAGDNKDSLIQTALTNFVQRHPFKGGQVAISVSGQASFARFIKLPPVEPKKIPEIVRFEAIQQIPFPLDDVEWSYQLFHSEQSPDVEVGIFAMRKELVNQQIKFYTDFDLNVQVVQMSPLAVYNAMYQDNKLDGTTMVIDLGAENTDLIICDTETIWLRSIPIGGNSFTDALVKAFKLSFPKAEEMKRNAATSKYARQIFQAMRPIFADLVAEIQRSVGFYASVHRDSRIKKVLALGGTFKLPGLQKYLQQNLQLDVERLDTITAAPSSENKLAPTFNENILSVVTAYGLAVQALGTSKITSSLLPAKIKREKMWKEKTPLFGVAASLFVVGAGIGLGSWFLNNMSANRAEATEARAKVTDVARDAKGLDASWSQVEGDTATARVQIANLQSTMEGRTLWARIWNDFQSALPQTGDKKLASMDPEVIKSIQRKDRKIVLIDSWSSTYYPDIRLVIDNLRSYAGTDQQAMAPAVRPGDPGAAPPDPAAAVRGFVVTLHCTTPYVSVQELIHERFIPSLLNIKPTPSNHRNYAIVKAQITDTKAIKEDDPGKAKLREMYKSAVQAATGDVSVSGPTAAPPTNPGYGEERIRGGNRGVAPVNPAANPGTGDAEDNAPFIDRVTGESILDDSNVTLVLLIAIDPPASGQIVGIQSTPVGGGAENPGGPAAPPPGFRHFRE